MGYSHKEMLHHVTRLTLFNFVFYRSSFTCTELSQDDRDNVATMDRDLGDVDGFYDGELGPPPGDEGFDISHEGGEHEVFEELAQEVANLTGQ